MQLPHDLQHFPTGALIVASDSVIAKFFLVGGDSLEELDGVALPRELKQDAEGEFVSFDGSRVAGPASDIDDRPRLTQFAKNVAARIESLIREQSVRAIHLVMPAEVEHTVFQSLSSEAQGHIGKKLHLDLMKEDPLSVIRRVVNALGTES